MHGVFSVNLVNVFVNSFFFQIKTTTNGLLWNGLTPWNRGHFILLRDSYIQDSNCNNQKNGVVRVSPYASHSNYGIHYYQSKNGVCKTVAKMNIHGIGQTIGLNIQLCKNYIQFAESVCKEEFSCYRNLLLRRCFIVSEKFWVLQIKRIIWTRKIVCQPGGRHKLYDLKTIRFLWMNWRYTNKLKLN